MEDAELQDIELFQKHVADRFADLLSPHSATATDRPADEENHATAPPPLMSVAWLRCLLDAFLCCEAEFKAIILSGRDPSHFSKSPLDRLIPDHLDRYVKALDVCNAVTHGIDLLINWQKLAEIAVTSLSQKPVGEGQIRRAKKTLSNLLTSMTFVDKENSGASFHGKSTERSKSLGRCPTTAGNFRSLSCSVAKSWSAAKQIQAMSANISQPRGAEANGPATAVFIMNTVIVFVMWSFVAAIPCQDRTGLATHFQVPRNLIWTQHIIGLQEKIADDWKKKEKKGGSGLLQEVVKMEKAANSLVEFSENFVFLLEEENAAELAALVEEMAEVCRKLDDGLAPLRRQVREVFHRMVRSRAEVLEIVEQVAKQSVPVPY